MKFDYTVVTENFNGSEILIREYKRLLKSIYGDDVNTQLYYKNLFEIFSNLFNKPLNYFYNLCFEQIFLLIIQLRINTLGPECAIQFKNEKKTIQLNLELIKEDITFLLEQWYTTKINLQSNFEIILQLPNLNRGEQILTSRGYLSLIKKSSIFNNNEILKTIEFENDIETAIFFEQLTPKTTNLIVDHYKKYLNSLNNLNFLSVYPGCENYNLGFAPKTEMLIWFTKLFFNESLDVFYNNIFYLSKIGSINLEYLENCCSPGEYNYFVQKLKQDMSAQNSDSNTLTNSSNIDSVEAVE